MNTPKYTVIALLLFGSLTACVNEQIDDDMLVALDRVEVDAPILIGGAIDEL
ncbi:hypothetical protein ACJOV8_007110 [Formosa sp. 3Alg 14/1]|uniref:hypothetical protein n=1 Tax=Formosa sp. 3Alg 14/1 TaxID=3382190 RepID=UPI0039BEB8F9